jgi:hypothetical protein
MTADANELQRAGTREAAMAAFAKAEAVGPCEDATDGLFRNRGSRASSGSTSCTAHIRRHAPERRASGS